MKVLNICVIYAAYRYAIEGVADLESFARLILCDSDFQNFLFVCFVFFVYRLFMVYDTRLYRRTYFTQKQLYTRSLYNCTLIVLTSSSLKK